jgi:5-methylcytosine-specific restriction endonuclease McrA
MDICKYCGKEISADKLSHKKNLARSYCNRTCYLSHVEKAKAPPRIKIQKPILPKIPIDYGISECVVCGKEFKKIIYHHLYCSNKCQLKGSRKRQKIKHKGFNRNGVVDNSITLKLLSDRDKHKCSICGGKVDITDFKYDENGNFIIGSKYPTIDHILPRTQGGTHTWDNVQLAHQICNSYKSDNMVYCRQSGQMALSM